MDELDEGFVGEEEGPSNSMPSLRIKVRLCLSDRQWHHPEELQVLQSAAQLHNVPVQASK